MIRENTHPHSILTNSRKNKAFTMIEFIVAASLTLLVLALGSQSLTSSQNTVKKASDREVMTSLITSTLAKSTAFGCGSEIKPDGLSNQECSNLIPLYNANQVVLNRIKALNSGISDIKGDGIFSTKLSQGYTTTPGIGGRSTDLSVLLSSAYVGSNGAQTDSCASSPASGSNLIKRTITVIWKDYLNREQSITISAFNASGLAQSFSGQSISYTIPNHPGLIALLIINSSNQGLVKVLPSSCSSGQSFVFRGLSSGTYTIKSYNIDSLGNVADVGTPEVRTV